LNVHTFDSWRRRLAAEQATPVEMRRAPRRGAAAAKADAFVPLTVTTEASTLAAPTQLAVCLRNGLELRVDAAADLDWLARAVRALSTC
jgi:hypothetical protein